MDWDLVCVFHDKLCCHLRLCLRDVAAVQRAKRNESFFLIVALLLLCRVSLNWKQLTVCERQQGELLPLCACGTHTALRRANKLHLAVY